jgi:uncharacterized protein YjiS (DUF1127 family)
MWLTRALLDQSAATHWQEVPFPLVTSTSSAMGDVAAYHRRPIKNSFGAVFSVWRARRQFRRELRRLLNLGPHLIADIGLTLDQARKEVARPFWRA